MYTHLLHLLACPQCGGALRLECFSDDGPWVEEGLLQCTCAATFPIILGVPRMLSGDQLYSSVNNDELERYRERNPRARELFAKGPSVAQPRKHGGSAGFYARMWARCDTEYGEEDKMDLRKMLGDTFRFENYRGKTVVDLGAGQGRWGVPFLLAGAEHIVLVDLGESIMQANEKFREEQNVLCVQSDVYSLPLPSVFDLAFFVGVLQHLPDPQRAMAAIASSLRAGGELFVWCYGESSLKAVIKAVRALTQRLSPRALWRAAYLLSIPRCLLTWCTRALNKAGLKALADRMPLGTYNGSMYFYRCNTFDHIGTPILNFFSRADVDALIAQTGLSTLRITEMNPKQAAASWVMHCVRPHGQPYCQGQQP